MSRQDKLLNKLADFKASMTWAELVTLMQARGFTLLNSKRGSGRKFFHAEKDLVVILHEPHPSKTLKPYMKAAALDALRKVGVSI